MSSETSYWYCPSTTVATRVASLNTELSHSLRMLLPLASAPCQCSLFMHPASAPCSYTPLPVPSRSCHTFCDTSPDDLASAHHRHTNPAALNSEPKSRPKDADKQAFACTARENIETIELVNSFNTCKNVARLKSPPRSPFSRRQMIGELQIARWNPQHEKVAQKVKYRD